ncbi:MAG TPA: hypothetical protein VGX69_05170 [Solirubrobacteraceae bacterium]|nr:hypothetical protein [Solirubrobacteraceae bacterium]
MRGARLAALALAAVALAGCETTQEKAARLRRQEKRLAVSQRGLSIGHRSSDVVVLGAAIVHDSERAAAVITLRNRSASTLRAVPIAITVKSAAGRTVFQNNAPGLESALVSVPSIAAYATVVWVDDQLQTSAAPARVSAEVGEAPTVAEAPPELAISAARITEDPANGTVATGTVANRSKVAQSSFAVFAVARRGGAIVAAGRAIVPELAAGASAPFQASLVGQASGARLLLYAPPASFG